MRTTSQRLISREPRGFTLIELLVVIAIIALLAAILFPVFAQAREKARQAACLSQAKQMGLAARMYAQDYDETWVMYSYGIEGPGVYSRGWGDGYGLMYWTITLEPYIKNKDIFYCPSKDGNSLFYGAWPKGKDNPPDSSNTAANCQGCSRFSWTWNGMERWPVAKQVDPNFAASGKTGFIGGSGGGYWYGDAVPDAKIEDSSGSIWIAEGRWPDIGDDDRTDYGWKLTQNDRKVGQFRGGYVRERHNEGLNCVYGDGHAKWSRWASTKPSMWSIQSD